MRQPANAQRANLRAGKATTRKYVRCYICICICVYFMYIYVYVYKVCIYRDICLCAYLYVYIDIFEGEARNRKLKSLKEAKLLWDEMQQGNMACTRKAGRRHDGGWYRPHSNASDCQRAPKKRTILQVFALPRTRHVFITRGSVRTTRCSTRGIEPHTFF